MTYTIILAAGVFLLLIGAGLTWNSISFFTDGVGVDALVADLHEQLESDGADTYAPIFEYQTRENRTIRKKYGITSNPPTWQVGETVRIVYAKGNPEKMKVVTYFGLFRWSIITVTLGVACTVVGLGHVLFEKYFM